MRGVKPNKKYFMNFWTAVVSLFLILNSLGSIPLFLALLARFPLKRQKFIIIREMVIALVILVIFGLFGDRALKLLNINQSVIEIAGGFLLLLVSVKMVFPQKESDVDSLHSEPVFFPLAVPLITGPGAITAAIVINSMIPSMITVLGILLLAWGASLAVLLAGSQIKRLLGEKGLTGLERFGGMIICLVAVQMLLTGIFRAVELYYPK